MRPFCCLRAAPSCLRSSTGVINHAPTSFAHVHLRAQLRLRRLRDPRRTSYVRAMERCQSGRMDRIRNPEYVSDVPRVRIPLSPPVARGARKILDLSPWRHMSAFAQLTLTVQAARIALCARCLLAASGDGAGVYWALTVRNAQPLPSVGTV